MNIKTIIFTIASLAILGFIGWKLFANKKVVDARMEEITEISFAIPVKTSPVILEDISKKQMLTGVFEANESLSLIAETQGTVRKINVNEGDEISKNSIILKIDDASLQAQYVSAQAGYEKAQKDLMRFEKLKSTGAVSQQQIEEVALVVKNTEANLEAINQQLSFTYVKSPIKGFVNEVLVEEGEFVRSGDKVAEVINVDYLKFILKVSESDLSFVKEDQEVSIKTDIYPLNPFIGTVNHISYKADNSKKYEVTIILANDKAHPLRVGMFGKATFNVNDNKESITIPRRAVIGSLKDAQVYVIENGNASLRSIVVGTKLDDKVVVIQGLQPNESVVTSGQINLTDGKLIRIVNQ